MNDFKTYLRVDNVNVAKIDSDTGVRPVREGYERTLILRQWHPTEKDWLAQVQIRIDRLPFESKVVGSIWLGDPGWSAVKYLPSSEFWREMPGYQRWGGEEAHFATLRLAARVITEMARMPL